MARAVSARRSNRCKGARLPRLRNLLAQAFIAAAPNQRWVGDTTEFAIGTSSEL